jgi:uncharacterized membrane protein (UPF0127 family)
MFTFSAYRKLNVRRAFYISMQVAPISLVLLASGCSRGTAAAPPAAAAPAQTPAAPAQTKPAPPYDMQFDTVQMIIKDQAFVIEIADDEAKVARGLMYRKSMDENHGMLFVFDKPDTYSFWMKNTLIPLDIIYIDADGKVLEIHDRKPLDETGKAPEKPALYVLELNENRAKAIGLKPGDKIAIPEKYLKKTPASTDK